MMPELGKYAVEVLSAYAVTLGLVVALVVVSMRQSVRTRTRLRDIENAQAARRAPPADTAQKETASHG
ncbi:heme exporter protein CcmD [Tropicimonas aquimaris]|uniref:Heme exporter protein D n=1 Tax=Tropicimonas aquimaris TaxID=914152 RepID=A0ABW3IK09_9RHOB